MARNRDEVLQALERHGLAEYASIVLDHLEPAVRMVGEARGAAIGESKLGGEPDLSPNVVWPLHASGRPMHLLAQVRLSDIPTGHLPEGMLPAQGLLYFWWDSLCWVLGDEWLSDGFQVTFEPDEMANLQRRSFPSFPEAQEEFTPYCELAIRMVPVMSIAKASIHALLSEAEKHFGGRDSFGRILRFYEDVLQQNLSLTGPRGNHRLLGDAFEMQSDMRQDCHRESRATGYPSRPSDPIPPQLLPYRPSTEDEKRPWRVLAMFDSDSRLGWEWSDVGELYYWIREQDLAERRFDLVHGIVESS